MTNTLAVRVDDEMAAILRTLNLDPSRPEVKALALVARRYQLDPVIGEIELIGNNQRGWKTYVTRDGMIRIAHRSGQLDGIVVDEQRRNSTNDGFTAFVSVWRKDMTHAFRYGAQCKDTERQAKEGYGLEQAVARAERRALKRAFAISGIDEEPVDTDAYMDVVRVDAQPARPVPVEGEVPVPAAVLEEERPAHANQGKPHPLAELADARATVSKWSTEDRNRFLTDHRIVDFNDPWPVTAVDDALERPF